MSFAIFRKSAAKPAAAAAAPLTGYDKVMHDSQIFLAAERARQPQVRGERRHKRPKAHRRGAGAGTFIMCLCLAVAAAVGTQLYLGGPLASHMQKLWQASTEAGQYFLS